MIIKGERISGQCIERKVFSLCIVLVIILSGVSTVSGQTKTPVQPKTNQNQTKNTNEAPVPNPVEIIMAESQGNINIDIPASIMESLMHKPTGIQGQGDLKKGINKLNGYRIQVFSDGRNQATLESRAKARGNAILARFPKYKGQVYTYSNAPNWFTRVGNFRTTEDASAAMAELKAAFPSFATEMRIVKSPIILIKK